MILLKSGVYVAITGIAGIVHGKLWPFLKPFLKSYFTVIVFASKLKYFQI
jgi:hypothetical protein